MIGNNSCGARSLIYGSTRDHLLEVNGFLSDGSPVEFKNIDKKTFAEKCQLNNLEGQIYRQFNEISSNPENQKLIKENYPDERLQRRNMGYALDLLLNNEVFSENSNQSFNPCKLIAGSEGTLMFITEAKLNLVEKPASCVGLVCIHLEKLEDSFQANLIAIEHKPTSIELMDNTILKLASANIEQQKNRFFVQGEPAAILIVEFVAQNFELIEEKANKLIDDLKQHQLGYAFPFVKGKDTSKVWNLRKAGLGVLSNMEGNSKPVAVIEDTAVHPEFLGAYMSDMEQMLAKLNLSCVHYAHIGTGEIHLRPVLNLKSKSERKLFRQVAVETAKLVKKYHGSLSGEHGDGRLRGEFIPFMFGNAVYQLLNNIKQTWDKENILNPGKIIDTPAMDTSMRFHDEYKYDIEKTYFDYSNDGSYLSAIEKCNGSADCRKSKVIGGTMCPSYMASQNETHTTRARANMLREIISTNQKPFDSKELYEILDLCLSCKACKSECPSNIDMAKFKAEFMQHYYDTHRIPLRSLAVANITKLYKIGSFSPHITNFFLKNKLVSKLIKSALKIEKTRDFPFLSKQTLNSWYKHQVKKEQKHEVYLFNDEFTNYLDTDIGIKAIILLERLGYSVNVLPQMESGRTYISKGLVKKAKKIATKNIKILNSILPPESILLGIEPSAILTLRDEYPELIKTTYKIISKQIAKHVFTVEEFLCAEYKKGHILSSQFTDLPAEILVHVHCQFKSIANKQDIMDVLSIPKNYIVKEIPSGCCGMAGSFGFEKEHYTLSMQIGELILFPAIRKSNKNTIISANGTSCRQQIKDGTGVHALHPIEILYNSIL
jgi:Fe-S oxidoreductase/FAD/FMN-containing dehydrogenase